jgi:glycosyltransferase involved in cell wall biosynthesis
MPKSPTFSIIIPSYNQGLYIEQALRSVFEQDYPGIELIVMDGGSQDGSVELLKKYSSQFSYWESLPDRGQAHAINKGFARATGEIITFLSSDDYYLLGAFFDVVARYKQNPNAGAIIGAFSFLDAGCSQPNDPILPFIKGSTPVDLTLGPPGKYRLHQVSTFYTRSALDVVGRYVREDLRYVMDRELLYRVCRRYPIHLSQKTYGVFRRHPESKSVAEILPFAREFADLYLSALSGDPVQDRMRKNMAAYRLSRGYVKYANAVRRFPDSLIYLARAGLTHPSLFLSMSYWKKFLSPASPSDRKILQEN